MISYKQNLPKRKGESPSGWTRITMFCHVLMDESGYKIRVSNNKFLVRMFLNDIITHDRIGIERKIKI